MDLEFAIAYDSDMDRAKAVLARVCEEAPMTLKENPPSIGVRRHDDSAVVLELLAWCRTEDYFKTDYYLKEEVKKAFDEEGIAIPFPQVDIHMTKQ